MNNNSVLKLYDCNSSDCSHRYTKNADGLFVFDDNLSAQETDGVIVGGVITGGNSQTGNHGGGVYVSTRSKFYMYGGTISGNTSMRHGGAVFSDAANATQKSETYLYGGKLCGNVATENGGGIYVTANAVCEMFDGFTISDNTCKGSHNGGGVFVNISARFDMSGGTISNNRATQYGGGVYVDGGTFEMSGGTIEHCSAHRGGGVYMSGNVTIGNAEISNNTSANHGGGIYVNNGSLVIDGGTVSSNVSGTYGGGMFVTAGCSVTVRGEAQISGNTAVTGGAAYIHQNATMQMEGGAISSNRASGNGGGVFLNIETGNFGRLVMTDGNITGNRANCGGGVYVAADSSANAVLEMSGGSIKNNEAVATPGLDNADNPIILNPFGGGVYAYGTVKLSGAADITGNNRYPTVPDDPDTLDPLDARADNLYLANDNRIEIAGKLANADDTAVASIGVGAAGAVADSVFTSGYSAHNTGNVATYFTSDDRTYLIENTTDGADIDGVFKACVHSGTTVTGTPDVATCTQNGAENYSCTYCGAQWSTPVPMLGHSFTTYTPNNNATCTANATETAHCAHSGCTETDTREIADSKLGHSFTTYTSNNNATCTANATETAHCAHSGCTETDTREIADSKLEHTYGEYVVVKEPTLEAAGEEQATCSVCGDVKSRVVPALTQAASQKKRNLLWLYILITLLAAAIAVFIAVFIARKKKRK
ncbi:MAG: hypothetical protein NC184_04595 [Roseburia sp.]|nr:hypothetical protein [Roseburia sp.]